MKSLALDIVKQTWSKTWTDGTDLYSVFFFVFCLVQNLNKTCIHLLLYFKHTSWHIHMGSIHFGLQLPTAGTFFIHAQNLQTDIAGITFLVKGLHLPKNAMSCNLIPHSCKSRFASRKWTVLWVNKAIELVLVGWKRGTWIEKVHGCKENRYKNISSLDVLWVLFIY